MVIFYNVLPCINCFDEGGVGDNKKGAVTKQPLKFKKLLVD